MKLEVFIPARLESRRFPNKIIKKIFDLPMILHVIKRAKYSNNLKKPIVVSSSKKIKKIIKKNDAKLIFSKNRHSSGTSRVAEISKKIKYKIALILFADEPFVDPKKIKSIINQLKNINDYDLINVVTNLDKNDMTSKEIVKCIVNRNGYIDDYFRYKKIKLKNKLKIFKSSGILIFKKKILDNFQKLKKSHREKINKIEQFKFLENKLKIKSIFVPNLYPSVNTPKELQNIVKLIKSKPKELVFIKKLQKL